MNRVDVKPALLSWVREGMICPIGLRTVAEIPLIFGHKCPIFKP